MIYLKIQGRIGNQLFQYAAARRLQLELQQAGKEEEILIEDYENQFALGVNDGKVYENSLKAYNLPNVRYVYDLSEYHKPQFFIKRCIMALNRQFRIKHPENRAIYEHEKKLASFYQNVGIYCLQDGYLPLPKAESLKLPYYMTGYFQSPKYFDSIREDLLGLFSLKDRVEKSGYPHLEEIQKSNTVCLSIKVQHNVGNPMFDVCNDGYYEKAIHYITEHVENPLFFVCSDNVEYVTEHFIDTEKYHVVTQQSDFPVEISLAVMAQCKHFIIGNTTFGWWAQYLSENEDKIVIAPDHWYGTDVPCDIYMDDWVKIATGDTNADL